MTREGSKTDTEKKYDAGAAEKLLTKKRRPLLKDLADILAFEATTGEEVRRLQTSLDPKDSEGVHALALKESQLALVKPHLEELGRKLQDVDEQLEAEFTKARAAISEYANLEVAAFKKRMLEVMEGAIGAERLKDDRLRIELANWVDGCPVYPYLWISGYRWNDNRGQLFAGRVAYVAAAFDRMNKAERIGDIDFYKDFATIPEEP